MTAEPRPGYRLNLLLFLATVLTTTLTGSMYVNDGLGRALARLPDGLVYSIPLMSILVCHEFGHYFAARAHRVPVSLPYFIPLPLLGLGTMGAVITQEATTDRKKLIDIGAAGPLAGLVVALPILAYGLHLSKVQLMVGEGLQEGNSILYYLLKRVVTGEWLPGDGRDVSLHPTAWAGWGGLLVTMLNLLPIGQLDGGHVATAYFGNRYSRAAAILHRGLVVLAVVVLLTVYLSSRRALVAMGYPPSDTVALEIGTMPAIFWLIWAALLLAMKRAAGGEYHPPVEGVPLPRSRRILFWVVCVTFLLTFMPAPLRKSIGRADTSNKSEATAVPGRP
jgi:membrane-associated protease RseP (regulator of RpoE activity)